MTRRPPASTAAAVAASPPTTATADVRSKSSGSFTVAAFLLVATTAVLADVIIRVGECRSFAAEEHRHLRRPNTDDDIVEDYQSDGAIAGDDDDEDLETEPGGGYNGSGTAGGPPPKILTTSQTMYTVQGTTVNLPCLMSEGFLDDTAVTWNNGTKNVLTDERIISPDPRIKLELPFQPSLTKPTNYTLKIENVNLWDSGTYTCKITSTPPSEITHTLHVTQPARIESIQSLPQATMSNSGVRKLVVTEDEPVQLTCNVEGYPKPVVQWTRKGKHHQHSSATTTTGHDQNTAQQPTVVSETNEVRIEMVSAHKHAGSYECVAHNSDVTDPAMFSRLSIELEVDYKPEVTVPKSVVNTGETYNAHLLCNAQSRPKSKVTWEKEQLSADGSSRWEPVVTDTANKRYTTKGSGGQNFALVVNSVSGQSDFGNYRCRAENKVGVTHSGNILLTGKPAQPSSTYVKPSSATAETKMPELRWTVDSWSPLLEYQLQYKKQQDSNWTDVRPKPVVAVTNSSKAGDEIKYTVAYVLGVDGQQTVPAADVVPSSLEPGTTYVARLRARNFHGWSDWSSDVVFSEASVGGSSSGGSDARKSSREAVATAFVLAFSVLMAVH